MSKENNPILPNDSNMSSRLDVLKDALYEDSHGSGHADDFTSDAEEGLSALSRGKTNALVSQLNADLAKKLRKNKRRRSKETGIRSDVYIIVMTVLLLIIISWIVIRKMS